MAEVNPLISVIVPVYNVAEYLPECVDSIINQTYTNLEIILVDDGSTDDCPRICDAYASKDSRIRVIHKENGGLSDARNAGLDICTGELIGFVDSDDFIDKNMYFKLYNASIKHTSDVSVCHYINDENGKCDQSKFACTMVLNSKYDMIHQVFSGGGGTLSACLKLYKHSIFDEVRFPKGRNYEDAYIILSVIENASRMVVIPDNLYFYRKRIGSITKTDIWNDKMWDGIFVYKHVLEVLKNNYPDLQNEGIRRLCWVYRENLARAMCVDDMREHTDDIKMVKKEFGEQIISFLRNPTISFRGKLDSILLCCLPISCYVFFRKTLGKL